MIVAFLIVLFLAASCLFFFLFRGRLRHVPGPAWSKLSALHLGFSDLSYTRNDRILEWHRQYGPVVCTSPFQVSVASLEGAKDMYGASQRWAKSDYFDHFKGYGMRSIFSTKPYDKHQAKRKLISAFYQASNIYKDPAIEQHCQERARAALRQIGSDQEIDVYSLTDWYALDNITYLTLGPDYCTYAVDHPGPERKILRDLKYLQFLMPFRISCPKIYGLVSASVGSLRPSYLLADEKLASWCWQRTSQAMSDSNLKNSRSLLRHLLEVHQGSKTMEPLNPQYIAAEVLDNINAAEATVAVTATYLIWRLTENPQWQQKIRKELRALPVQQDGSLSFAHVNDQAPSLDACLREVLRLHPASSGRAERIVPKGGCTFSGVFVPEDTVVTTCILALHRDESIFPEPGRFIPERWLNGDETSFRRLDSQLISFGIGGRICLGKSLAIMEIKVLIANLYLEYETVMTTVSNADSMRQCSTHDAVPKALECVVRFQRAEK